MQLHMACSPTFAFSRFRKAQPRIGQHTCRMKAAWEPSMCLQAIVSDRKTDESDESSGH